MTEKYNDSMLKVTEFLTGDKNKAEYVLNCFNQQERHDLDEMNKAEGIITLQQKYQTRMGAKKEQIGTIMPDLSNFKNESFKLRVAELIQWSMLQLDLPKLYDHFFSRQLKNNLIDLKRYDGDLNVMAQDVNRKFKFISPTTKLPES